MKNITFLFALVLLISGCGETQIQMSSDNLINENTSKTNQISQNEDDNKKIVENPTTCDSGMKRVDYQLCLSDELKRLDKDLDKEYSSAAESLQKNHTKKAISNLSDAQNSWKSYRKVNCLAEKETYGKGTDADGAELNCYLKLTNERIVEIKRIYRSK